MSLTNLLLKLARKSLSKRTARLDKKKKELMESIKAIGIAFDTTSGELQKNIDIERGIDEAMGNNC